MEMLQQLLMAIFATFVFSILIFDKLSFITTNGGEHKSNRGNGGLSTGCKKKSKSKKKVRFAIHDEIAIIVDDKIVRLDSTKLSEDKQLFVRTSYDLKEVYVGSNWIGEELMICMEVGLCAKAQELGFDNSNIKDQTVDDNILNHFTPKEL